MTDLNRAGAHCWNCGGAYAWDECVNEPGAVPGEGSVGICARCRSWWEMKDGVRVPHVPTPEEEAMVEGKI